MVSRSWRAMARDRRPAALGGGEVVVDGVDQCPGAGGRRLERGVGDLVGDAAVDLVAEPGEHGDRAGGDRQRDRLGVERGQLVAGAAAADHDDAVEIAAPGRACESRRPPSAPPTHPARACRRRRGGTRNPLRSSSSRKSCHAAEPTLATTPTRSGIGDRRRARLASNRPPATSAPHDLVARLRQLAEREARIDPGHLEAEPSGRCVEVELAEDADLHAVGELEPAALEDRREVALHRGEQRDVEHGPALRRRPRRARSRCGRPLSRRPSISPRTHTPSSKPRRSCWLMASASSPTV